MADEPDDPNLRQRAPTLKDDYGRAARQPSGKEGPFAPIVNALFAIGA